MQQIVKENASMVKPLFPSSHPTPTLLPDANTAAKAEGTIFHRTRSHYNLDRTEAFIYCEAKMTINSFYYKTTLFSYSLIFCFHPPDAIIMKLQQPAPCIHLLQPTPDRTDPFQRAFATDSSHLSLTRERLTASCNTTHFQPTRTICCNRFGTRCNEKNRSLRAYKSNRIGVKNQVIEASTS